MLFVAGLLLVCEVADEFFCDRQQCCDINLCRLLGLHGCRVCVRQRSSQ